MKNVTPVEMGEIVKEAENINKSFVGFVDLPDNFRTPFYIENMDMAVYRLLMINDTIDDYIEEAISSKINAQKEKKVTTRILIGKEYLSLYEELLQRMNGSIIDTVYMLFTEITNNKEIYKL